MLELEAPQDFIESFVQVIVGYIPTSQAIYDSFFLDWTPSYIATPSELEAAVRRARRELLRPASREALTLSLRSLRRTAEREEVGASL